MKRRALHCGPFVALIACATASPGAPASDGGGDGGERDGVGDGDGSAPAVAYACPPGAWAQDDGHCEPAGIPPSACPTGFVADGDLGCAAVLPSAPCPADQVAWLGDTACHDIVDCGTRRWGDIPVDAATVYVDGAYAGDDGDGSPARPWRTIQRGVDHAQPGAIVAVAAGAYTEMVAVATVGVRLWGRCPRLVRLVAPAAAAGAVLRSLAPIEIHALGVDGNPTTYVSVDATLVDGVDVTTPFSQVLGPASDVRLIRRSRLAAPINTSTDTWIDESIVHGPALVGVVVNRLGGAVIRATQIDGCDDDVSYQGIGGLTIDRTLLRGATRYGVFVGSTAPVRILGTTILDVGIAGVEVSGPHGDDTNVVDVATTTIRGVGTGGGAADGGAETAAAAVDVDVQSGSATVDLRGVRISGATFSGISVAGNVAATVTGVAVDGLRVDATGFALGLSILGPPNAPSTAGLVLDGSRFDGAVGVGIAIEDAAATVTATIVRGTRAVGGGSYGDGVDVVRQLAPTSLYAANTRVETSARAGIASFGGAVTVGGVTLVDDAIDLDGESTTGGATASFVDEGGDVCIAAGVPRACIAQSVRLTPPRPLGH